MALTLMADSEGFHFSGRSMQITKEKNALLKPYEDFPADSGVNQQFCKK